MGLCINPNPRRTLGAERQYLAVLVHSMILVSSLWLLVGAQESRAWLLAVAALGTIALGVELLVLRTASPRGRLAVRFGLADPRLVYNSFMIQTCSRSIDATASEALTVTVSAVEDAALQCKQLGAHFLVLLAPAAMLVDRALFDLFFDRQQEYERQDYSPDILHARLTSQCERRGIAVLDLLPVLRRRQAKEQECYHPEGHWNAFGHQVVGHELASYLTERGWI